MIKYKANFNSWATPIEEVNFESETEHFVIRSSGRKDKKETVWYKMFDRKEDAKSFLIARKEEEIKNGEEHIADLKSDLQKLQAL